MPVKATLITPKVSSAAAAAAVASVETLTQVHDVGGVAVPSTTTIAPEAAADTAFEKTLYGNGNVTAGTETAPTSTAVATIPQTETAVARTITSGDEGEFEGEFDGSDLKFPTLGIVQGSGGPLVENFAQGDLIFDSQLLYPAPRPKEPSQILRVIPLHIAKSYREQLSQDQVTAQEMPRLFKTKAEVVAAGLSFQWFNNPDPSVRPSARIIFLLEAPAGTEHPGFGLELDGKAYALGIYYAKTGAYKETAQTIWNIYQTVLFVPVLDAQGQQVKDEAGRLKKRKCLYKSFWNWQWGQVKAGNFNPWRPSMRLTRDETGPQVREFCSELLRGRSEVSGD